MEFREDPVAFTKKWTEELGLVYRIHLYGRVIIKYKINIMILCYYYSLITYTKIMYNVLTLCTAMAIQIHTVASGKYAREVFMSDNFDFVVGTRKVRIYVAVTNVYK